MKSAARVACVALHRAAGGLQRWSATTVRRGRPGRRRRRHRRAGHPRVVRAARRAGRRQFEEETGYDLEVRASGDAGDAHQQAGAHQGQPDRRRGVRRRQHLRVARPRRGRASPSTTSTLPGGRRAVRPARATTADLLDPGRQRQRLRQRRQHLVRRPRPGAADDARGPRRPRLRGLFVTPRRCPARPGWRSCWPRSPQYGDDWPDYWERLMANGAKLVDGWEDAYYGRLHPGRRATAPADRAVLRLLAGVHRRRRRASTTSALLDTCFRQVEYAGVLGRRGEPRGCRALVEFLLGRPVQAALPEACTSSRSSTASSCPPDWAKYAEQPESPYTRRPGRDRRATARPG